MSKKFNFKNWWRELLSYWDDGISKDCQRPAQWQKLGNSQSNCRHRWFKKKITLQLEADGSVCNMNQEPLELPGQPRRALILTLKTLNLGKVVSKSKGPKEWEQKTCALWFCVQNHITPVVILHNLCYPIWPDNSPKMSIRSCIAKKCQGNIPLWTETKVIHLHERMQILTLCWNVKRYSYRRIPFLWTAYFTKVKKKLHFLLSKWIEKLGESLKKSY